MDIKRTEMLLQQEKILACSHQLAELIKNSPEFINYKKAKENLKQSDSSMELLLKFRTLQMKQQLNDFGQLENSALTKELDDIYFTLSMHQEINDFLNAEYCFTKLLNQIQKVFVVDLEMPQEILALSQLN